MTTKIKLGMPIDLEYDDRYYQQNRQFAIRDVFDALVELITNSDDSYGRLFKRRKRLEDGGSILIEILKKNKEPSQVIIRDKAEGMTLETMRNKLGNVGKRRSEKGDRGFMARGAKDCTELGKVIYESILDNKYYKCELTPKPQFIPIEAKSANSEIRRSLGIKHGNGTVVTLLIEKQDKLRIPLIETIIRDLPWHYALRDILSELNPSKVLVRSLNHKAKTSEKAVYRQPEGKLVCSESFYVPGYPKAKAKLIIWKAPEPFDDPSDRRFRRHGLIIKGRRAIHECSLLYPGFEKDPYATSYFGRLECDYIDTLLDEYDRRRENDEPHTRENPRLLVDPNRREGLIREHPFTKSLFKIPMERLKALLEKDKEKEKQSRKEISSFEIKNKLSQLAKAASKFLADQVEELEELTTGDDVDKNDFFNKGVLIYPTYLNIAIGQIGKLTFYTNDSLFKNVDSVRIKSHDKAVNVLDSQVKLVKHNRKENRLMGSFRIRGEHIKDSVCIEAFAGADLPTAEAVIQVVDKKIEEHNFYSNLEFEHKEYQVKEGSKRTLRIFAKHPEIVNQPVVLRVDSSDNESVPIRGKTILAPISGTNYALGEVIVQGRRLKSKSKILASLNGFRAETNVRVKQQENKGSDIKIEIRDEDYGDYRARWADHENKPNVLLISAKHNSIRRYLGPPPNFEGQETPYFRILLAEIVAESVCRKSLMMEAQARPWEFRWADLKDDKMIADDVLTRFQKRLRNFVEVAHKIMLQTAELESK